MKKIREKILVVILVVVFMIISSDNAWASTDVLEGNNTLTKADEVKIISALALNGKSIVGGEEMTVDGKFRLVTEVIIDKPASSGISTMSVTNSYSATCNVYVYSFPFEKLMGVITHTISLTHNDSGLVHINSGTLSFSARLANWSGTPYGYNITNTDGTYSSAIGNVECYDDNKNRYASFRATATVTKASNPSFSFTQF